MKSFLHALISCGMFLVACASGEPALGAEEMRLAGGDPGIEIHAVRHKARKPNGAVPVLMLHPFGAPCADAFDLPGYSWAQDLAAAGFDVWAVDMRGFARSSKPQGDSPVGRAADAVRDMKQVVDAIKQRTGARQVAIIAWSWGGVVAPMFAAAHPADVNRMVLLGAMHGFVLPMMTEPFAAPGDNNRFAPAQTAYQRLDATLALAHWRMMLKGREDIASPDAIAKAEALMRRCGNAQTIDGKEIVVRPMGPLADLFEIWSNRPLYDASRVSTPTLVVAGDRDVFADRALAWKLPHATDFVIPDATHWVPFETKRDVLFRATREFLSR